MAAKLTRARIAAALRRAGRQRRIDTTAADLCQRLLRPQLHQPPQIEEAMATHALALLATLNTECVNVDRLAHAITNAFQQHPDYEAFTRGYCRYLLRKPGKARRARAALAFAACSGWPESTAT